MGSRLPLFNTGQLVKVFTYYNDMIIRDVSVAVITGVNTYYIGQTDNVQHIYNVFSHKNPMLQTAEEFAIKPLVGE